MTQKSSFHEIISAEQPVLVDFFAEWCGPCKTLAPILKQFAGLHTDKVKVIKVDIDKNNNLAAQFGIQSVPTVILFKAGKAVWRQSGVVPLPYLKEAVKPFLNS